MSHAVVYREFLSEDWGPDAVSVTVTEHRGEVTGVSLDISLGGQSVSLGVGRWDTDADTEALKKLFQAAKEALAQATLIVPSHTLDGDE